jgi:hypothetical protein
VSHAPLKIERPQAWPLEDYLSKSLPMATGKQAGQTFVAEVTSGVNGAFVAGQSSMYDPSTLVEEGNFAAHPGL